MAGRPHCAVVARDGRVAIRIASRWRCCRCFPSSRLRQLSDREIDARVERTARSDDGGREDRAASGRSMGAAGKIRDDLRRQRSSGSIGSVLNEVDVATVNELQRIAVKESRLGIPLLIGERRHSRVQDCAADPARTGSDLGTDRPCERRRSASRPSKLLHRA